MVLFGRTLKEALAMAGLEREDPFENVGSNVIESAGHPDGEPVAEPEDIAESISDDEYCIFVDAVRKVSTALDVPGIDLTDVGAAGTTGEEEIIDDVAQVWKAGQRDVDGNVIDYLAGQVALVINGELFYVTVTQG